MAESSNSVERRIGYYCHVCKCRIPSITESFTCPDCNSGFIEEVESSQRDNNNDVFSIFSSSNELPTENFFNMLNEINLFGNNDAPNNIQIGRFLSSVIGAGQANGAPIIRLLHGNPDDYVWSTDGLDTVITQLLNQIDNTGPPPMKEEDINNLNEIEITKEHVNLNLQCPICMDDYIESEKVKELNCNHFFHAPCISEWLKLHATCPTCRTNLTSTNEDSKSASTSNTTIRQQRENNSEGTSSNSVNQHRSNPADYDFSDDLD